jgi:transketolase
VREGGRGTVLAVGLTLDNVLAATEGQDVTVLYASTIRPFDHCGLRAAGHTVHGLDPAGIARTVREFLR